MEHRAHSGGRRWSCRCRCTLVASVDGWSGKPARLRADSSIEATLRCAKRQRWSGCCSAAQESQLQGRHRPWRSTRPSAPMARTGANWARRVSSLVKPRRFCVDVLQAAVSAGLSMRLLE